MTTIIPPAPRRRIAIDIRGLKNGNTRVWRVYWMDKNDPPEDLRWQAGGDYPTRKAARQAAAALR